MCSHLELENRSVNTLQRFRWVMPALIGLCVTSLLANPALAQRKKSDKTAADSEPAVAMLDYTNPREIEMLIGLRIIARDGALSYMTATTVFPTEWPEQKVEILETSFPANVQHAFRDLPGNNRQLLMSAELVPALQTTEGTIKVRVTKSHIVAPVDPSILVIPKKLPKELKLFMDNSPYIDADNAQVKRIARDIAEQKPENAWAQVKLIYDWVREHITYTRGEMKDTLHTLKDKTGDCEEMTSLFVAICRASRVPARCVWIPGHCYPEFYLEDEDGHGFWFPCQAAGSESFGAMADHLPILQKGDRFIVPEKKMEKQRYLADYLTSKKLVGQQKPKVEFIRQLLGDAANLKTADEPPAP